MHGLQLPRTTNTAGADGHDFVSWESRYVGHIRAINAAPLDAYLLKSLDSVAATPTAQGCIMVKCGAGRSKVCLFLKAPDSIKTDVDTEMIHLGTYSTRDEWAVKLVAELEAAGLADAYDLQQDSGSMFNFEHMWVGVTKPGGGHGDGRHAHVVGQGTMTMQARSLNVKASALGNATLVDLLVELTRRGGNPYPLIYDTVIRCLGWVHDLGMYGASATPRMQYNNKYPIMTSEYESINVPNLFFAGQLAHGKDHLRSAGGFIHGFRYTARNLFRMLQARHNTAEAWPKEATAVFAGVQRWDGQTGLGPNGCNPGDWTHEREAQGCQEPATINTAFEGLVNKLFNRINTASGPYQMVAVLGDGVVFSCPGGAGTAQRGTAKGGLVPGGGDVQAHYFEEMSLDYFNTRFAGAARMFWHFGYAKQRQSLHDSRKHGTFFQIHVWWTDGRCGSVLSRPASGSGSGRAGGVDTEVPVKEILRIGEDFNTNWDAYETRRRVGEWVFSKLNATLVQEAGARKSAAAKHAEPTAAVSAEARKQSLVQVRALKGELAAAREKYTLNTCQQLNSGDSHDEASELAEATKSLRTQCRLLEIDIRGIQEKAVLLLKGLKQAANPGGPRGPPLAVAMGAGVLPAVGTVDWEDAESWINECFETSRVAVKESQALKDKRLASCGIELGREWPGGRVEVNIANHCDKAVSLWQGSVLFTPTPVFILVSMMEAGEADRKVSHEGEVWAMKDGAGNIVRQWTISVTNGIVQDLLLDCSDGGVPVPPFEAATPASIAHVLSHAHL